MIHYLYVMKVEAIFISDVHLGARGVQSETLLETLKKYNPVEIKKGSSEFPFSLLPQQ
jgi:hypothetical protein